MLNAAEEAGWLQPGGTIVEQTSGNTGIGLAAFAAERGYRLEVFLERGASLERRLLLQAYGVRLLDYKDATGDRPETERTHPWQEPEREATLEEIAAYCRSTGAYFNNQAANPANPEAHYRTTGPEIWQDTEKMWMFWSAWQAPAAPALARLAICESRIRYLKSCWYSPIRIPVLRQSIRTFRLSMGFCRVWCA